MAKRYKIKVNDNAFEKAKQRSGLSTRKQPYTRTVVEMNEAVEALDRFDDFSYLRIDPSKYKKTEGPFGIKLMPGKNDGIIMQHQRSAALGFLKELRGFGLLADVVGSGKTFEAAVVLSELAVRGMVKSMLLVVPRQVYSSWVTVVEEYFGLGFGVLKTLGDKVDYESFEYDYVENGGFYRPKCPMIVKMEDFVKWDEDTKKLLFDVIVVDEAHHLCDEEGEYAGAMRLLSLLMRTKQQANKTFCLLLSATPHSGNLDHMFRLWYFIRYKGGNPDDFLEKDDTERTAHYNDEKKYYHDHICRGASTVMEFINKVKISECTVAHRAELEKYLTKTGETFSHFNAKMEAEKLLTVDRFLDDEDTPRSVASEVEGAIASAYHNGVLRSIMIRQPNTIMAKKKMVKNFMFFPMEVEPSVIKTRGIDNKPITVDIGSLYEGKPITVNGERYSIRDYVEEARGYKRINQAMGELMVDGIVNAVGARAPIFTKPNSGQYYSQQWKNLPVGVDCVLEPYKFGSVDPFELKFSKTKELLRTHASERVLIFFDYELKGEENQTERFINALKNEAEFNERILVGSGKNRGSVEEEFNGKEDAILIVTDASFTEGINLQRSKVIINFQVTPDPLAMDQRIGRIFRLGQDADEVEIYSLANMNELEGYVLMYFSRIGLLSSNNGDATIIAGSNNEHMVTVRCPRCHNVKLYSKEEYEIRKEEGSLYCDATSFCTEDDRRGTVMEEITTYDFKCDKCETVFSRSEEEEGYLCVSSNNSFKGIMCNSGDEGDKCLYCRKICAIAHCSRFTEFGGKMYGECKALQKYEMDRNVSDAELMMECQFCRHRETCKQKGCIVGFGPEAIAKCSKCREGATCSPKPHKLEFNERWEAKCPICKDNGVDGKLKPIYAKTFATFIRGAWNFKYDGGEAFSKNLMEESRKVAYIKTILDQDKR